MPSSLVLSRTQSFEHDYRIFTTTKRGNNNTHSRASSSSSSSSSSSFREKLELLLGKFLEEFCQRGLATFLEGAQNPPKTLNEDCAQVGRHLAHMNDEKLLRELVRPVNLIENNNKEDKKNHRRGGETT